MDRAETNQEAYNRGFEQGKFEGKQEGRKEVVEFIYKELWPLPASLIIILNERFGKQLSRKS